VSELRSAPLPPLRPDDHVRGPANAPLVIAYADYECHFCLLGNARLDELTVRRAFRHFPVRSRRPRGWAAACAAEAAARQGRFWEMHDSLYEDQGRLDDPHLWARAERLGLDVERFDAERRSEAVVARVKRDFDAGIRAGVTTTPTFFFEGRAYAGAVPAILYDAVRQKDQR
jgi:protein-disulfide isomerase